MFRFLFRTTFRLVRFVGRVGLLTALGFALVKLVQNRRGASPVGAAAEWAAAPPRRTDGARAGGDTPLVEPHMLRGVSLKRPEETDGQGTAATAMTAPPPAPVRAPVPTQPAKPVVVAAEVGGAEPLGDSTTTASAAATGTRSTRSGTSASGGAKARAATRSTASPAARVPAAPKAAGSAKAATAAKATKATKATKTAKKAVRAAKKSAATAGVKKATVKRAATKQVAAVQKAATKKAAVKKTSSRRPPA